MGQSQKEWLVFYNDSHLSQLDPRLRLQRAPPCGLDHTPVEAVCSPALQPLCAGKHAAFTRPPASVTRISIVGGCDVIGVNLSRCEMSDSWCWIGISVYEKKWRWRPRFIKPLPCEYIRFVVFQAKCPSDHISEELPVLLTLSVVMAPGAVTMQPPFSPLGNTKSS